MSINDYSIFNDPKFTGTWVTPSQSAISSTFVSNNYFPGNVTVSGKIVCMELENRLAKIEERLAILSGVDQEKLDMYPSLQAAYDKYKTIEALITGDPNEST